MHSFIQQTFTAHLLCASSHAGHWVYNKQNWYLPSWNSLLGSQTVNKQLVSEFDTCSGKGLYPVGVGNRTCALES